MHWFSSPFYYFSLYAENIYAPANTGLGASGMAFFPFANLGSKRSI
jgi:hypothetical protein